MHIPKLKSLFAGLAAAFVVMTSSASVLAEGLDDISGGIVITPPNQSMILTPGKTYTYSVEVFNPSSAVSAINAHAHVAPFSVKADSLNYDLEFSTMSNYTQIADWITIQNPDATIEPNQKAVIKYTIRVPQDAPAGGQYATISVQNLPKGESEGNVGISETMEIASLIYATVIGDTTESGEITSMNIPSFNFNSTVSAESIVKNTGNVHSTAKYTLQVFPLFSDEEVYTNAEDPGSAVIIPNQSYYNNQTWQGPLVGIFKVVQTVSFAGTESSIEKFVILCPIWLLFIILAVIIFIILWIFTKSKKRRASKK